MMKPSDVGVESSRWVPDPRQWADARYLLSRAGLALNDREVHAWLFNLDRTPLPAPELAASLNESERERAARLVFARDRHRFVAGRGMLRVLLGRYVGVGPADIAFRTGAHGKPALASAESGTSIEFNLSHSGGWCLLGVSRSVRLGVDIEAHRDIADAEDIARGHFSGGELRRFLALPAAQRSTAFYACWTRKEAYVKAIGEGLAARLESFEVGFAPGEPPRLRSIQGSAKSAREWTLWDCDVGPDMTAAVVAQGTGIRLRQMAIS